MSLLTLPPELSAECLTYLSTAELCSLLTVCRELHSYSAHCHTHSSSTAEEPDVFYPLAVRTWQHSRLPAPLLALQQNLSTVQYNLLASTQSHTYIHLLHYTTPYPTSINTTRFYNRRNTDSMTVMEWNGELAHNLWTAHRNALKIDAATLEPYAAAIQQRERAASSVHVVDDDTAMEAAVEDEADADAMDPTDLLDMNFEFLDEAGMIEMLRTRIEQYMSRHAIEVFTADGVQADVEREEHEIEHGDEAGGMDVVEQDTEMNAAENETHSDENEQEDEGASGHESDEQAEDEDADADAETEADADADADAAEDLSDTMAEDDSELYEEDSEDSDIDEGFGDALSDNDLDDDVTLRALIDATIMTDQHHQREHTQQQPSANADTATASTAPPTTYNAATLAQLIHSTFTRASERRTRVFEATQRNEISAYHAAAYVPYENIAELEQRMHTSEEQHENPLCIAVQFTGSDLGGDRCVIADRPFPPLIQSRPMPFTILQLVPQQQHEHDSISNATEDTAVASSFTALTQPLASPTKRKTTEPPAATTPTVAVHKRVKTDSDEIQSLEEDSTAESSDSNDSIQRSYELAASLSLVAYYEVTILPDPSEHKVERAALQYNGGEDEAGSGCVAVGLCTKDFRLRGYQPGWTKNSIGVHSDDGHLYCIGERPKGFAPPFTAGDTIGCGIDYANDGIFYTLNGCYLGVALRAVSETFLSALYPVIGIDTRALVLVNFGGSAPFLFDLRAYHAEHIPAALLASFTPVRLHSLYDENQLKRRSAEQRRHAVFSCSEAATADSCEHVHEPPVRPRMAWQ